MYVWDVCIRVCNACGWRWLRNRGLAGGSLHMYCIGMALESSTGKRSYDVDGMGSVPIRPQGGCWLLHMIG